MSVRDLTQATVSDMINMLLYYDRRDDEELPPGAIEMAIGHGAFTQDDMVRWFAEALEKGIRNA